MAVWLTPFPREAITLSGLFMSYVELRIVVLISWSEDSAVLDKRSVLLK